MRRFVKIKQGRPKTREVLIEFVGAILGMGLLVLMTQLTNVPLLWAPLGGTMVLVFGAHASPFSQPMNVLGGHLLTATLAFIAFAFLPHNTVSLIFVVAATFVAMRLCRLTHPPAGANAIVIYLTQASWFVVLPALAFGVAIILTLGFFVHKFSVTAYPAH